MEIVNKTYKWNGALSNRKSTKYIIIHHMAGNGSADDIHRIHQMNGWVGIGYHFFIRKDGIVYRGRPIEKSGAHTSNYNSVSIGICFEGNYETTKTMPEAQIKAGQELIATLKGLYPSATIKRHKDFNSTACPGKYFPFDEITSGKVTTNIKTETKTETKNKGVTTVTVTLNQLEKGAEGKQVKTLQNLLIASGFSCGTSGADGDFGTNTDKAVRNFQKKNGLTVDGIVGANTWNKLLK